MSELEQLKERVERLENFVADMQNGTKAVPRWKRQAGLFAGDEAFDEIVRLGAKVRWADRPEAAAKPRPAGKRAVKRSA